MAAGEREAGGVVDGAALGDLEDVVTGVGEGVAGRPLEGGGLAVALEDGGEDGAAAFEGYRNGLKEDVSGLIGLGVCRVSGLVEDV